ncbi:toxin glutamine deamidase domain-containing protein, partial [Saccharopolyspora thermophila]|uniref:toxin glutamine deamidase domain-containing protein n=1 Tax=Saccharopolyspora thermophila TaxID=89367 RepID=UPI001E49E4A9
MGSDVISAETFADDEGAERAFLGEFFPNLSGVNRPVGAGDVAGRESNCAPSSIQALNADAFPGRVGEFRAGPSGVVHRDDVPLSGLPPMVRQENGYDGVIAFAKARDGDGPCGLVFAWFGSDRGGHYFTVHKRGDSVVFVDAQRNRLQVLGNPVEVWFSPYTGGTELFPVYTPVGSRGAVAQAGPARGEFSGGQRVAAQGAAAYDSTGWGG